MRILSKSGVFILIILLLLTAGHAVCQDEDDAALQGVDALLFQGENLQAWELLKRFPEEGPGSEAILWRMARTQYEMGRLVDSDEMALEYFQSAEKYARKAIAAKPDMSDGYKWLAIALGAQAKNRDTKTQVRQSREIKESIEKAIELDPADDLAYLVLSRWHYKVSALGFFARTYADIVYGGLPEASLKNAENLVLQAIELRDRIAHRYNLGKIYDRLNRREDARTQYQQALLLTVTFPEEAEELDKVRKKMQKWQ
jgi:tetratricopeptide (TPR) repeat protein